MEGQEGYRGKVLVLSSGRPESSRIAGYLRDAEFDVGQITRYKNTQGNATSFMYANGLGTKRSYSYGKELVKDIRLGSSDIMVVESHTFSDGLRGGISLFQGAAEGAPIVYVPGLLEAAKILDDISPEAAKYQQAFIKLDGKARRLQIRRLRKGRNALYQEEMFNRSESIVFESEYFLNLAKLFYPEYAHNMLVIPFPGTNMHQYAESDWRKWRVDGSNLTKAYLEPGNGELYQLGRPSHSFLSDRDAMKALKEGTRSSWVLERGAPFIRERFAPRKEKLILYKGGFGDEDVVELVSAFNRLADDMAIERAGVKLLMLGEGRPEELMARVKPEERIKPVHRKKIHAVDARKDGYVIASYYKASDVAVVPGHHNSMPLPALDALALEIPLVVEDIGIVGNALVEKGLAVGYRPRNPAHLSRQLRMVFSNSNNARKMAQKGHEAVIDKFTKHAVTSLYVDLFSEIRSRHEQGNN